MKKLMLLGLVIGLCFGLIGIASAATLPTDGSMPLPTTSGGVTRLPYIYENGVLIAVVNNAQGDTTLYTNGRPDRIANSHGTIISDYIYQGGQLRAIVDRQYGDGRYDQLQNKEGNFDTFGSYGTWFDDYGRAAYRIGLTGEGTDTPEVRFTKFTYDGITGFRKEASEYLGGSDVGKTAVAKTTFVNGRESSWVNLAPNDINVNGGSEMSRQYTYVGGLLSEVSTQVRQAGGSTIVTNVQKYMAGELAGIYRNSQLIQDFKYLNGRLNSVLDVENQRETFYNEHGKEAYVMQDGKKTVEYIYTASHQLQFMKNYAYDVPAGSATDVKDGVADGRRTTEKWEFGRFGIVLPNGHQTLTNPEEGNLDPYIRGTIVKLGTQYYLQTADGSKFLLMLSQAGDHDPSKYSVWLADTDAAQLSNGAGGGDITVIVNGQFQVIDYAAYGIQVQDFGSWLAANVGKSVELFANRSTDSGAIYVLGVKNPDYQLQPQDIYNW